MSQPNQRNFSCKDEELPIIAGFILASFNRDLADFTAFSPKYNAEYAAGLQSQIDAVAAVVAPEEETALLKRLTKTLYANMKMLVQPLNKLEVYLEMAIESIGISAKDFGIVQARKAAHGRDAEQLIDQMRLVNHNVARYRDALMAQGLSQEQIDLLTATLPLIQADNQQQYNIVSNRRQLVLDNIDLLNDLNTELKRICKTGKALYKNDSPAKVPDYTFSALKKEVGNLKKQEEETLADQ